MSPLYFLPIRSLTYLSLLTQRMLCLCFLLQLWLFRSALLDGTMHLFLSCFFKCIFHCHANHECCLLSGAQSLCSPSVLCSQGCSLSLGFCFSRNDQKQELTNFDCKQSDSKCFRLLGHVVPVTATQICCYSAKQHRKYVNDGCGSVPKKLYVQNQVALNLTCGCGLLTPGFKQSTHFSKTFQSANWVKKVLLFTCDLSRWSWWLGA